MKVLERGDDLWRSVECPFCKSTLLIEDEDVSVERFWDGEDACYDSRAFAFCVVCQRRLGLDVPDSLKKHRLFAKEILDLEKLGEECAKEDTTIHMIGDKSSWSISVRKGTICLSSGKGDR